MPRANTPTNPREGHYVDLFRVPKGRSATWGRPLYGTTMRCSCGFLVRDLSNESPSTSGAKAAAREVYARHLADVDLATPAPELIRLEAVRFSADGATMVIASQLIGTSIVTLHAYERAAGHSTIHSDPDPACTGWWGTITSRPLPESISRLTPGSPERIAAVVHAQLGLEAEARGAIYRLFPEVAAYAGNYGCVQLLNAEVIR